MLAEYGDALGSLFTALRMYQNIYLSEPHSAILNTLLALGDMCFADCDYDQALKLFDEALATWPDGSEGLPQTLLLTKVARASLCAQDFDKYIKVTQRLISVRRREGGDIGRLLLELGVVCEQSVPVRDMNTEDETALLLQAAGYLDEAHSVFAGHGDREKMDSARALVSLSRVQRRLRNDSDCDKCESMVTTVLGELFDRQTNWLLQVHMAQGGVFEEDKQQMASQLAQIDRELKFSSGCYSKLAVPLRKGESRCGCKCDQESHRWTSDSDTHGLESTLAVTSRLCDECNASIDVGESVHSCSRCDFDLCAPCSKKETNVCQGWKQQLPEPHHGLNSEQREIRSRFIQQVGEAPFTLD